MSNTEDIWNKYIKCERIGFITMTDTVNENPDLLKYKKGNKIKNKDFFIPQEKGIEYYLLHILQKGIYPLIKYYKCK